MSTDGEYRGYLPPHASLRELLSYSNPNQAKYVRLAHSAQEGFKDRDPTLRETSYDSYWDGKDNMELKTPKREQALQILRNKLPGQILCDLGGARGVLSRFAKECETADYIVVDPFLDIEYEGQLDRTTKELIVAPDKLQPKNKRFVQNDSLLFTSQLKEDSCSFTVNGLDNVIIGNENYHHNLAEEIVRATKPGGIIFCRRSSVGFFLDKNLKLKKLFFDDFKEAYIFEKK